MDGVADVMGMLAQNGHITGQTINVNGGWYMGYISRKMCLRLNTCGRSQQEQPVRVNLAPETYPMAAKSNMYAEATT